MLQPTTDMSDSLNLSNDEDAAIARRLQEAIGDQFAERVAIDRVWAKEVLGVSE